MSCEVGNESIYMERERERERRGEGEGEKRKTERERVILRNWLVLSWELAEVLVVISCHFDDSHSNSVR